MYALSIKEAEQNRDAIRKAHLLLTFFYAMQPGAFSFSVSDLLGVLKRQTIDLLGSNPHTLYGSLPSQMQNMNSFAMQLRKMLSIRIDTAIDRAELISVPQTEQKGLLILIHKLQGGGTTQLLAVNFGKTAAQQTLEMPSFRQTTAIDLMTGLAETKPLNSSMIQLNLPPLSGKVILFQPKYYD